MSNLVGADIEQLRSLATTFEGNADRLTTALDVVTRHLAELPWSGTDAEEFRHEWYDRHRPAAERAASGLSELAETLKANADDQEETSEGLGATSGGESAAVSPAAVSPAVYPAGGSPAVASPAVSPAVSPDAVSPAADARTASDLPADLAANNMAAANTVPTNDGTDGGRGGDGGGDADGEAGPELPMGPFAPGHAPGEEGGPGYVIGPPTKPDIEWDDDFEYDSAEPTFGDYTDWAAWGAKGEAAHFAWPDAGAFYSHYRDRTGEPKEFRYESAYNADEGVRELVDIEIARTQQGVEELIAAGHDGEFSVTGDAHSTEADDGYPTTTNWQRTIGGYQQWSSADVRVDGDQATMTVTVHAEDYYNFNDGEADIASGTPDQVNGRFQELGWAQGFESHGELTREVTWTVGDPNSVQVTEPEGQ